MALYDVIPPTTYKKDISSKAYTPSGLFWIHTEERDIKSDKLRETKYGCWALLKNSYVSIEVNERGYCRCWAYLDGERLPEKNFSDCLNAIIHFEREIINR